MSGERKQLRRIKRVFINRIDSYSSKHIVKYLSTCTEGTSGEARRPAQGSPRFHIVGTVQKKEKKRRFTLEEYSVEGMIQTIALKCCDPWDDTALQLLLSKALGKDELLQRLMNCDVIVYNISEDSEDIDEATWAISALNSEIEQFKSPKMFILVSTLMTWARTKPVDPFNPEIPLMEEDYPRRRPHSNFREHISAEKLVLKLGKTEKSKLRTYVIGAGMQYGMEESLLHVFFQACWLGKLSSILIPEPSTNIIPTIHVHDLANIVKNVIDLKPRTHYLIAVDDSHSSLEEIVKAIADALGPGEVQKVPSDSMFFTDEFLKQKDLDYLNINLLIETFLLKRRLDMDWVCESGLIQNIDQIVEEYRQSRRLLPIKIYLLGPPTVRSLIAEQLCKHYAIHYIDVREVVVEKIPILEKMIQETIQDEYTEEILEVTQKELNSLREVLSQNEGQSYNEVVLPVVREKLHSKPCRNQGYVLDGYPVTHEQANKLFHDVKKKPGMFRTLLLPHDERIIPDYVFSLDYPEAAPKPNQETGEESILDYFDELEIHLEHIEINSTVHPDTDAVMKKIIEVVGGPTNYGPTPEEIEEQERKIAEEEQQRLLQDEAMRALRQAEEEARMAFLQEEWKRNRAEVEKEEQELLEARSLPLRHYLMKYVMPTLRDGLVACAKLKPEDPIDFLAEYLLNSED